MALLLGLPEPMALILGSPGPLALLGALVGVSLGTTAPPLLGLLASSLVVLVLVPALLSLDLLALLLGLLALLLLVGPMVLLLGPAGLLSLGLLGPPMLNPPASLRVGSLVPLRVDPPVLLLVPLVGLVLAPGLMLRVWLACLARICWFGVWLIGSWKLDWCWWAAASLVWPR